MSNYFGFSYTLCHVTIKDVNNYILKEFRKVIGPRKVKVCRSNFGYSLEDNCTLFLIFLD